MTDTERIMDHFNATAKCRKRREANPKLSYEPGCAYIQCEHADCRCIINDGDGGPLSELIARWERRNGAI